MLTPRVRVAIDGMSGTSLKIGPSAYRPGPLCFHAVAGSYRHLNDRGRDEI